MTQDIMMPNNLKIFIDDVKDIIKKYRAEAAISLNQTIIHERWEIGRRIVEEDQRGELRAEYGAKLINVLSKAMTTELGKGYNPRSLAYYRQLYTYFPDWEILHTRVQNLTWSHLKMILGEKSEPARLWYMKEAAKQMWSVKTFDLVFYNYLLKCFVLIDLKTTRITHQDVGQMDMYVRMYDDLKRSEVDNPTIGLLLCAETSQDIARYSVLNGSNQLFASKYLTYLPTNDELRQEIEYQKRIYLTQKGEL